MKGKRILEVESDASYFRIRFRSLARINLSMRVRFNGWRSEGKNQKSIRKMIRNKTLNQNKRITKRN